MSSNFTEIYFVNVTYLATLYKRNTIYFCTYTKEINPTQFFPYSIGAYTYFVHMDNFDHIYFFFLHRFYHAIKR